MTAIAFHQSGFSLKSASNCQIVLLAQTDCMHSLTKALGSFFVLRPSFVARLSVWRGQSTKLGSQKIVDASGIVLTTQEGHHSRSSICHGLFNLTAERHPHTAKLRSTSSLVWLLANSRVLVKVLSSFLLPILLNGKRRRNRGALGQKASSKAAFLIYPLHNSSEDVFLLLPLQPLIVSSSLCLLAPKSGVGVFGKDNTGKGRGDDLGSIDADRGTRADNPGTGTDKDVGADDPGTAAGNSSTAIDNLGTAADDSGKAANHQGKTADNPGIGTDANAGADNPGIGTDADAGADEQQ